MVEGGDFLVPNKKVEHCLNGCKYLYNLIYCGVLKSVHFTCVRWLFWHMPSTNPVDPVHRTIASN